MFHAKPYPFAPRHRTGSAAETARKIARFAVQPRLVGTFAQAAYHGALEVAARLAATPSPDLRLALLTDMYIHWQHDVPYKIADASAVTGAEEEPLLSLIARLCREGAVLRYRGGSAREKLHAETRIELAPAYRAELSGAFARIHAGGDGPADWG